MDKAELKATVVVLLEEVLKARFSGVAYARLSRAHGYADGYMRALQDASLVDKHELLELVGTTRREFVERDAVVPAVVQVPQPA